MNRRGHKFTEPLQARSPSEAHFSSFYSSQQSASIITQGLVNTSQRTQRPHSIVDLFCKIDGSEERNLVVDL